MAIGEASPTTLALLTESVSTQRQTRLLAERALYLQLSAQTQLPINDITTCTTSSNNILISHTTLSCHFDSISRYHLPLIQISTMFVSHYQYF
jgi:hypothetical protein